MLLRQRPSFVGKILLTSSLFIVSAIYVVWQNITGGFITQRTNTIPSSPMMPNRTPFSFQSMMGGPMMGHGRYVDGSYTGDAADAFYGILQVKATIQGGNIVDVQFLQHADSTENSRFINDRAMPLLTQEAITVQHAQVDGVSGATFTSSAFRASLASALAQAQN